MRGRDLLVGDIFANNAAAVPERTAAVLGERSLTFGEIDRIGNAAGRALVARGVGIGDRVVTWAGTTLDAVGLFAGLAKSGAVYAPMNGGLSAGEVVAMVGLARPALVVVDDARLDEGRELSATVGADCVGMAELAGEAASCSQDPLRAELSEADPHVIFFTSGSTGAPKGVVLSHRTNVLRSHPGSQLEPHGDMICMFPMFHMGAWTISLHQWQCRYAVHYVPPDATSLADAITRFGVSRINCIPAVWQRILDLIASPDGSGYDLSSLKIVDTGTSATPLALLEAIRRAAPQAHMRVFYGSTEAGNVAMLDHDDIVARPGSVGTVSPFQEVQLSDEGELLVRGSVMFDGYFENREADAEAFEGDWFRTGDLVDRDADGFLYVVGRARDVIRTGGETVAPVEVEAVLADHPDIAEVAVIGLPDERWGEIVCAVVVPSGERSPSVEDLRVHCAGRLTSFKHPRRVEVIDAIPRTASTGQTLRRVLVARFSR